MEVAFSMKTLDYITHTQTPGFPEANAPAAQYYPGSSPIRVWQVLANVEVVKTPDIGTGCDADPIPESRLALRSIREVLNTPRSIVKINIKRSIHRLSLKKSGEFHVHTDKKMKQSNPPNEIKLLNAYIEC
jgi:hypothetical protein